MTKSMRSTIIYLLALGAGLVPGLSACSSSRSVGRLGSSSRLTVSLTGAPNTQQAPLALTFDAPEKFVLKIVAEKSDGSIDTGFNSFVRVSVKPGNVVGLEGENTSGRSVKLTAGVAENITVGVISSFGETHVWAEDIGYTPVDPGRTPPPLCANGKDDNEDGLVDFPADPGCAFANDDSEDTGTYATGASPAVYFRLPRIADVRGYSQGGNGTAFPHQQVLMDTGWRPEEREFEFSTVVTRVSTDGFYATDLGETRGFASIFAFNFSAPPLMRVCDRLKYYGGTASDFFGFTEMGFPTWELEEWNPNVRDCLVPEPYPFKVSDLTQPPAIATTPALTSHVSSLVRVISEGDVSLHISAHFGPGYPAMPDLVPTADASNCDINKDGKVDFATEPEKSCSTHCTNDPDCTEFSNYLSRSAFRLVLTNNDPDNRDTRAIQADGSSSPQFDPVLLKGKQIKAFSGTLRFFSGGSQYTLEARCNDDIVTDPNGTPVASNTACVHPRTISDNNSGSN